jgi:hypothetical protein
LLARRIPNPKFEQGEYFALRLVTLASTAACLMLCIARTCSAAPETSTTIITLVARGTELNPVNLVGPNAHCISASHIFMIISHPTDHGPKEDAHGYYPKDGVGMIKGPGMLKPEYRCNANDDCNASEYKKISSEAVRNRAFG